MATKTKHLELTKPESTDKIDPYLFADNFDKIDEFASNCVTRSDINDITTAVDNLKLNVGNIGDLLDSINGEVI